MSSTTPAALSVSVTDPGTFSLAYGTGQVFGDSRLVHVEVSRRRVERFEGAAVDASTDRTVVTGRLADSTLDAVWSATRIGGEHVWEFALELVNTGDAPVTITRMDPLAAHLVGGRWTTLAFASAWGDEWRPVTGTTDYHHRIGTRSGRSSHGMSPWFGLERAGAGVVVAPAWSGNWHIDLEEGTRVSAGISTWAFELELAPGERVTAPSVVVAIGASRDAATVALTSAIGRDWIPRSPASERLDVEWNHWWPYEDAEVTEQVIWDNARVAADLGVGFATVDAGWFGPSDPSTYWGDYRGDWALVNEHRFPSGLEALGAGIRAAGVRAGIWAEAEAVGSLARVRREHPEIMALAVDGRRHDPSYGLSSQSLDPDDPTFLGYVCLGSEAGRAFVLDAMSAAVERMGAEWIKLDFNVDPDAGCSRTDHGHGSGDGLFRHYEGLYAVLDAFRANNPEVVLEDCSSGGMRLDLGIARHVHTTFLSDPDYTEHALQVLWGASLLLPPAAILHWSWSQWRGDYPAQRLDFDALTDEQFATTLRAAMLHRFGFSLRLPELPARHIAVLRQHVALYREHIADLVRDGVLHRLTDQPQRGGLGERAPALQLSHGGRHVIAQFVLDGGEAPRAVAPVIESGRAVRATDLATGGELALGAGGIQLDSRGGAVTSWLILVEEIDAHA